jgi:hypothetical protein
MLLLIALQIGPKFGSQCIFGINVLMAIENAAELGSLVGFREFKAG